MFKYANNILPEPISELFISNTAYHSYNTRNRQNLRHKVSKRAYMYKNFSFIGVQIWNDVTKHINMSPYHLAHLKSIHEHIICITTQVYYNIIFILSANI